MIIQTTKDSELKEVASLFMEVYAEPPYNEKWTEKNALAKIKMFYKTERILVAIEDNKIVGLIIYQKIIWDTALKVFIDEVGVKKEYRNKGIATQLLKKVEEDAKKEGLVTIELISNMKSKAFNLYKKLNYHETDCILMEKKI